MNTVNSSEIDYFENSSGNKHIICLLPCLYMLSDILLILFFA